MCRYRQPGIVAVLTQNSTDPLTEDKPTWATAEAKEYVALVRCADPKPVPHRADP
jgi:hypothetical protein